MRETLSEASAISFVYLLLLLSLLQEIMYESEQERDERPVARLDKAQIEALLATVMKEMDKKLEFVGATRPTNNVFGTSSQVRRVAREKRKGKRLAVVGEHEDPDTSYGRSTEEEERSVRSARSGRAASQTRTATRRAPRDRHDDNLGNLKLQIPIFSGTNKPDDYLD